MQAYSRQPSGDYTVLFYNIENFFDLKDDTLTMDEEFTPAGDRRWTIKRFNKKVLDISKVILNASGWEPPQMIALCEVENRYVLERLINHTPLKNFSYQIIHKESPDWRGIDVAFIYNPEVFYPLEYAYYPLKLGKDSILRTRELLYVSGIVGESDTLHFFINHWPSRYDGLLETQSLRNLAAEVLRQLFVQKMREHPCGKVIILGDFNDQPEDESVSDHLGAREVSGYSEPDDIINLSYPWLDDDMGTLKYRSQWFVFDQIMVSGSLLKRDCGVYTEHSLAHIVKLPFLLERDERYGGVRPKRTYIGYRYNGGFSDHLPVLLELKSVP